MYVHSVNVGAVADDLGVSANALALDEDSSELLEIFPDRSIDSDDSETLSVKLTAPSDGVGLIGVLTSTTAVANVVFTDEGGGVYLVTASGPDAETRETALATFLNGSVPFTLRLQFSTVRTGNQGIKVEVISTEDAPDLGDLGPNDSARSIESEYLPTFNWTSQVAPRLVAGFLS